MRAGWLAGRRAGGQACAERVRPAGRHGRLYPPEHACTQVEPRLLEVNEYHRRSYWRLQQIRDKPTTAKQTRNLRLQTTAQLANGLFAYTFHSNSKATIGSSVGEPPSCCMHETGRSLSDGNGAHGRRDNLGSRAMENSTTEMRRLCPASIVG